MAKRTPWPEYDENEAWDNETSMLWTLISTYDATWTNAAKQLNETFGNNRTPAACRRKAVQMKFI